MSVFITSLNSGSNGNCYYVGTHNEAVLVDVGLSCREIEIRMKKLGLSMEKVKAVFVSHEHTDHIKGVATLVNRYYLPLYITPPTASKLKLIRHLSRSFESDQPIQVGSFTVTPFKKFHDAVDPHSFLISAHGIHVGVFTDIGSVCDKLTEYFSKCHAAFLESNYDEEMLENGGYPIHLKNRIRGGHGHLSNREALTLFKQHKAEHLSLLLLSHLSKENNNPQLALELFRAHAGNTHIAVASRYGASEIFEVSAPNNPNSSLPKIKPGIQQSLFA
ncbi:MAG: hypothetical protein RLY16_912 [Bacteroidota bacterium]